MYNFIIRLYACFVRLVSPFHKKAKQMVCGQKNTYRILGEKIDPHAKHIWVHCASLGEFEQARPMIETLKKEHPEYRIVLTFFLLPAMKCERVFVCRRCLLSAFRYAQEGDRISRFGQTDACHFRQIRILV